MLRHVVNIAALGAVYAVIAAAGVVLVFAAARGLI